MSDKDNNAGKIKRILLIRHGYSLGNHDKSAYDKYGDPHVPLHPEGWKQAVRLGAFLKEYYAKNPPHYEGGPSLWVSSYQRCLETLSGAIHGADGALDHCSEGIRKSPHLVEQDAGMIFHIDKEDEKKGTISLEGSFTKARSEQNKFFARLPHGESPFDTYQRMESPIASMARSAEEGGANDFACFMHGISMKTFAMRFLNLSERAWNDIKIPRNTDVLEIALQKDGSYSFRKVYDGKLGQAMDIDFLANIQKKNPKLSRHTLPSVPKEFRIR